MARCSAGAGASLAASGAAAKAVSHYLSKSRPTGQRIPLPAVPGAPDTERHGDGERTEDEEAKLRAILMRMRQDEVGYLDCLTLVLQG